MLVKINNIRGRRKPAWAGADRTGQGRSTGGGQGRGRRGRTGHDQGTTDFFIGGGGRKSDSMTTVRKHLKIILNEI